MHTAFVPAPDLVIREGVARSECFGDVYFSRLGGVAESTHVCLHGNRLPERFAHRSPFRIAETGFGTGLNFLVAWRSFLEHAPPGHQLQYFSLEKFPLTLEQLQQALSLQPELATLAHALIEAYPLRLPGLHRVHLPRVTLTLAFGEAAAMLSEVPAASIDAWFLDGFAPAKNPEMWSEPVLGHIARASAPAATFATFTAASIVRRGLSARGFTVEKAPGYAHKRDMLVGYYTPSAHASRSADGPREPERDARTRGVGSISSTPIKRVSAQPILILGAGIAGATAARALAERGYPVTVLERDDIASGASGNPAAVLFPPLPKRWNLAAAWYFTGYGFLLRQLARWRQEGLTLPHAQCGMLRLPRHASEAAQLQELTATLGLDPNIVHWITRDEASALAGLPLPTGAAYFPHGTWLDPATLCRGLLQHPNIAVHTQREVTSLTRHSNVWRADTLNGQRFDAPHCLLTTAEHTAALIPRHRLRLHLVAGQISQLSTTDVSHELRCILCYKGYVIPLPGQYVLGATYDHYDLSRRVTAENHAHTMRDVAEILPDWVRNMPERGRTSIRATTPDRLPYIGQLAEGLWVSTGHGSRGMLSAPLGAEMIASAIAGETAPVTAELSHAVRPTRFTPLGN